MQAHTICLRCHQKCHLIAEVADGKVVAVVDATPNNRTPPCREVCPIEMDVPGYVIAASQGKFDKAMEVIRDTNPFPMVCGRICHHPCEKECIRLEASDSPFKGHFIVEKGKISGRSGLLHFKDEDFRFMGSTETLIKLLTGDLALGFNNMKLQTAGHSGWVSRVSPIMREVSKLLKGASDLTLSGNPNIEIWEKDRLPIDKS